MSILHMTIYVLSIHNSPLCMYQTYIYISSICNMDIMAILHLSNCSILHMRNISMLHMDHIWMIYIYIFFFNHIWEIHHPINISSICDMDIIMYIKDIYGAHYIYIWHTYICNMDTMAILHMRKISSIWDMDIMAPTMYI